MVRGGQRAGSYGQWSFEMVRELGAVVEVLEWVGEG